MAASDSNPNPASNTTSAKLPTPIEVPATLASLKTLLHQTQATKQSHLLSYSTASSESLTQLLHSKLPQTLQNQTRASGLATHESTHTHTRELLTLLNDIKTKVTPLNLHIQSLDGTLSTLSSSITLHRDCVQMKISCENGRDAFYKGELNNAVNCVVVFNSIISRYTPSNPLYSDMMELLGTLPIEQNNSTTNSLKTTLFDSYEQAIETSNLNEISTYVPLLGKLGLGNEAVGLYMRYAKGLLKDELSPLSSSSSSSSSDYDVSQASKVQAKLQVVKSRLTMLFNNAVKVLRHHLPMVSMSLGIANGDIALLKLINTEVEAYALKDILHATEFIEIKGRNEGAKTNYVENLIESINTSIGRGEYYLTTDLNELHISINNESESNKLKSTTPNSTPIKLSDGTNSSKTSDALVERLPPSKEGVGGLDSQLEEAALVISYLASYSMFVGHCAEEIGRAGEIRKGHADNKEKDGADEKAANDSLKSAEILAHITPLAESTILLGSAYAVSENVLLLLSIHKALSLPMSYTPLQDSHDFDTSESNSKESYGASSVVVEDVFYTVNRSALRALSSKHCLTACTVLNLCCSALHLVLTDVMFGVRVGKACDVIIKLIKQHKSTTSVQGSTISNANLKSMGQDYLRDFGFGSFAGASQSQSSARSDEDGGEGSANAGSSISQILSVTLSSFNDNSLSLFYLEKLSESLGSQVEYIFADVDLKNMRQLKEAIMSFDGLKVSLNSRSIMEDLGVGLYSSFVRLFLEQCSGSGSNSSNGATGVDDTTFKMNYLLNESQHTKLEQTGGYLPLLCQEIDSLLLPLTPFISASLSDELLLVVMRETCKKLELLIRKLKFSTFGSLKLDSDVRYLTSFMKSRLNATSLQSTSGLYARLEGVERLSNVCQVLNCEDAECLSELIRRVDSEGVGGGGGGGRGGGFRLKAKEVRGYGRLRVWD